MTHYIIPYRVNNSPISFYNEALSKLKEFYSFEEGKKEVERLKKEYNSSQGQLVDFDLVPLGD